MKLKHKKYQNKYYNTHIFCIAVFGDYSVLYDLITLRVLGEQHLCLQLWICVPL